MNLHERFKKIVLYVSSFILCAGVLINLTDIVSRELIGGSIPWAQQVTIWCVIAVSYLVAGIQLKDGTHINVDFISARQRGLSKKIFMVVTHLIVAVVTGFLLIGGIKYVVIVFRRGFTIAMGTGEVGMWIPYLFCMVIGLAILMVYSVLEFFFSIKNLMKTEA